VKLPNDEKILVSLDPSKHPTIELLVFEICTQANIFKDTHSYVLKLGDSTIKDIKTI
jgi:hypothetical protein